MTSFSTTRTVVGLIFQTLRWSRRYSSRKSWLGLRLIVLITPMLEAWRLGACLLYREMLTRRVSEFLPSSSGQVASRTGKSWTLCFRMFGRLMRDWEISERNELQILSARNAL